MEISVAIDEEDLGYPVPWLRKGDKWI